VAIKRIILPNTGIYQRNVRQAVLRSEDPESLNDVLKLLARVSSARRLDDPSLLSDLTAEITGFLKEFAASDMRDSALKVGNEAASDELEYVIPKHVEEARRVLQGEFRRRLSQEEKREFNRRLIRVERAADACEMLDLISVIQDLVEYGSNQVRYGRVEQVLAHSFALGRAYERFKIREFEAKAWTGDKILQAAHRGGIAAKAPADQKFKAEQLVVKFNASGLSQRSFARTAGISRSSLQRAFKLIKIMDSNPAK
jgi:hypothetical protein